MEIIVVGVTILVMAIILGVDITVISAGIMVILSLCLLFIVGFFIACTAWLVGAKGCRGRFSRIDKSPKYKFNCAFYTVDGEEYPNVFPCEIILKKYLYKPNAHCKLLVNRKKGIVFDTNALACVIAGLTLGTLSLVMTVDYTAVLFGQGIF